ncbi:MAG: fasciclin domain-containing protein [Candidatus Obscuribacterales bacterium]
MSFASKSFLLAGVITLTVSSLPALADGMEEGGKPEPRRTLIAAKTKRFEYKEGFERRPKDIINTLKDNEVTRFQTLLDGLDQAFSLDNTLKNAGPYTLFAPSDAAFKKIPYEDVQSLWANKKKLKQVLSYHIVKGKFSLDDLRKTSTLKTIEGHTLTIKTQGQDVYADKALITTADVPASNGIVHVIDLVVMPPLSK